MGLSTDLHTHGVNKHFCNETWGWVMMELLLEVKHRLKAESWVNHQLMMSGDSRLSQMNWWLCLVRSGIRVSNIQVVIQVIMQVHISITTSISVSVSSKLLKAEVNQLGVSGYLVMCLWYQQMDKLDVVKYWREMWLYHRFKKRCKGTSGFLEHFNNRCNVYQVNFQLLTQATDDTIKCLKVSKNVILGIIWILKCPNTFNMFFPLRAQVIMCHIHV